MVNRIANFIHNQSNLIEQIRSRPILANPFGFIDDKTGDLERAVDQLRGELVLQLDRAEAKLESDRGVLRSLSPRGVLDRGYAVIRDASGHVVNDASKVKPKQTLKIRLAKGELEATAND
jgi:exodeoxyribonuclease VII large subunit